MTDTDPGAPAALGLYMSSDHRYWHNGGGPYPSVTTILRVLDKPALGNWYKRQVAEAAVYRQADWQQKLPAEAVTWLMSMPDTKRDNAATLGSSIHLLADIAARRPQDGLGGSEQEKPYLEAFQRFLGQEDAPSVVSSEHAILNLSEGYAGTYDLLVQWQGDLWLLDVKTGKGVYADYALQLAAYGMAEHIAIQGDPSLYPFPEPARYGVLHLRPDTYPGDGYKVIEYAITDRERLAFLAALELWRWNKERANDIRLG